MAILFALVYPDQPTAEKAALSAKGLEEFGYMAILESSIISKNSKGKIEHHGERHTVRTGVAAGAAFGGLIGKWAKSGASEDFVQFRDQVTRDLQPGGAALVLIVETDARDRVIYDLGQYGGILRSTDVSKEQLAEVQAALDKVAAGSESSP